MQATIDHRYKVNAQDIINTSISNPNLTHHQVAELHNISRARVSQILDKYNVNREELEDYKNNRADIFAHLQKVITESLTSDDIKKAPVGTRVLMACQLYDKERLERGQSTENVLNVNVLKRLDDNTNELRSTLDALKSVDNSTSQPNIRDNVIEHDAHEQNTQLNQATSHKPCTVNLRDNVTQGKGAAQAQQRRRGRPRKA